MDNNIQMKKNCQIIFCQLRLNAEVEVVKMGRYCVFCYWDETWDTEFSLFEAKKVFLEYKLGTIGA